MTKTLYRALLPSGRGVKFRRMNTRDYLSTQQRVAAKLGDKKDPGGGMARTLLSVELVSMCLVAITTEPLAWRYRTVEADAPAEGEAGDVADAMLAESATAAPPKEPRQEVDVDGMLDAADTENRWTPVTYGDLMKREGPLAFDALFDELRDFETMVGLASGLGREDPTRGANLLSKVQVVSSA